MKTTYHRSGSYGRGAHAAPPCRARGRRRRSPAAVTSLSRYRVGKRPSPPLHEFRHDLRRVIDHRHDARVIQPRRTDDAEHADDSFWALSRKGAAIIDEPESENSLFSEPMKMRTPSPASARDRRSMTSFFVSRSANSRRMRSRSSSAVRSSEQIGLAAHDQLLRLASSPAQLASPASTRRAVSSPSSASTARREASISPRVSSIVRPRMRALR